MSGTGFQKTIFKSFFDKSGSFRPTEISEHHHCRKNDRTRIHNVFTCNVRSSPMRCLKDSMAGFIIDICSRSNAYATYHCSQLVRNIISVQVQSGYYRIFFGNEQCILQKCVGNAVLYLAYHPPKRHQTHVAPTHNPTF